MKRTKQVDKVMRNIIISFILGFSLLLPNSNLIAQNTTDPVTIFKMMLYIDRPNVHFSEMDSSIIKDDSLLGLFNQCYDLKLDTLKIVKNEFEVDFFNDEPFDGFLFFRLSNEHILEQNCKRGYEQYLGIYMHRDVDYIIGIDLKRGICYRLQGFVGNDFLVFLSDFKERYKTKKNKHITNTTFIKGFIVEDLDFKCLYKGLKAKELDTNKYPCLIKCSDFISAHKSY